jgi:hypothetical protein
MKGHGESGIAKRDRAIEEIRQEIQGRLPKGSFAFSSDLSFSDIAPAEGDSPAVARFKKALKRDARYATAAPVYLRKFGFSQAMRSVYDGGRQLIEGGAK